MDTQETKIYIAALIASGVLGAILIFFIVTMIKQQRITKRLHLEKIQAEILAHEKQRRKIASDLHDDLGPLLSAIKFKINAIDLQGSDDKELIQEVNEHIDDTLDQVRKISFDLLPNTLVRKGLVQTLEEYIPKVEKLVPTKIKFLHNGITKLPGEIEVNLYRIILEIINNTVKHSYANNLKLELRKEEKKIVLLTADDGAGFSYDKREMTQGLGLKNLQSRTDVMKGELFIETFPGKGVKYNIEIPLS